jgi:tellurite resistance protein
MSPRTGRPILPVAQSALKRLAVGSFAIVAGLCSFSVTFREVERILGFGAPVVSLQTLVALIAFVMVAGLYVGKVFSSWPHVRAEFSNPISTQHFLTATISLLLLPVVIYPYQPALSVLLWHVAAAIHFALMIVMVRDWITHTFIIGMFSPVWFLSVGGTLVSAMTGVRLGLTELSWFFFSVGLATCGAMFTIAMYRLFFHDRVSTASTPSLFILMTPPSVGFLAYIRLAEGQLNVLSRTLFFSAVFVASVQASLTPVFMRSEFSLGWLAYTFPSAALTMAVLRCHVIMWTTLSLILVAAVLPVASLLIFATCMRTVGWLFHLLRAGLHRTE